jgi:hypothetical protein
MSEEIRPVRAISGWHLLVKSVSATLFGILGVLLARDAFRPGWILRLPVFLLDDNAPPWRIHGLIVGGVLAGWGLATLWLWDRRRHRLKRVSSQG